MAIRIDEYGHIIRDDPEQPHNYSGNNNTQNGNATPSNDRLFVMPNSTQMENPSPVPLERPRSHNGLIGVLAAIGIVIFLVVAIKSCSSDSDRNAGSNYGPGANAPTGNYNNYTDNYDTNNGSNSMDNTQNSTLPTREPIKLSVDPYSQADTSIEPYSKSETSIPNANFNYFSGTISQSSQEDTYSFTTNEAGVYRIELADMVSGFRVSMYVYDANGLRVDYNTDIGLGSGVTVSLNANSTYQLVIKSSSGIGSYTVFIGEQKSTVSLNGYTTIYDSTEFSGQQNNYSFTPSVSGVYRFYISQINSGIRVSMYVYDDAGYRVDYNSDIGQGSGVTVTLEAGKTYALLVKQSSSVGNYTLAVGYQKATTDITGYTVINDSTEFSDQQNNYSFTPSVSGVYRFYISQINSGIRVSMYIYDDAGYRVDYNTDIGQDSGVTVTLEAGKTYALLVKQSSSVGNYTLAVGYQKETADISKYDVISDSIQFSGQENKYIYTPSMTGEYTFKVSDMASGCKISIYVYDSAGYRVDYNTDMSTGNSLRVNLDANSTYSIMVKQSSGNGNYTISTSK